MKKALLLAAFSAFIMNVVFAGTITVTYPNTFMIWCSGRSYKITWTETGISQMVHVVLRKYRPGGVYNGEKILTSLPAGILSFSWTVVKENDGFVEFGTGWDLKYSYRIAVWSGNKSIYGLSDRIEFSFCRDRTMSPNKIL